LKLAQFNKNIGLWYKQSLLFFWISFSKRECQST
jgi:hypothetical protein